MCFAERVIGIKMIISNLVTVTNFILNSLAQKGLIFELRKEISFRNFLRLLCWLSNRFSFIGPHTVLIDIANECHLNCIMCMYHSPFRGQHREDNMQDGIFPLDRYIRLINELKSLRVNRVFITGRGEPLLHPDIEEMVSIANKAKIDTFINTNGTCLTNERIEKLLSCGLSGFDLSLHAGDPLTYKLIHPQCREELFEQLREHLIYLIKLREKTRQKFRLVIINVIARPNYDKITEMLEFAKLVKADKVIFKPILAFKEIKETFALRKEDIEELKRKLAIVKTGITNNIPEFINFLNLFLEKKQVPHNKISCNKICHIPWTKANICINGDVKGCIYGDLYGEQKILGNIYKESFVTIYRSNKYLRYRQQHLCPAICYGKAVYHLVI